MSLVQRWSADWPDQPELGRRLMALWQEPWRHYHGSQHLAEALEAGDLLGCTRLERLSLWFHDAVHRNRPGEDEPASAELAASWLVSAGWAPAETAEVTRLILLTGHHRPLAADEAGARVCDADLAVLGAPPARYQESVAQLRAEQGLDEAGWRAARRAAVGHLLATHRYATATGRALWGARSRANLRAELDRLTA
ncbi:HD domain-containing protein [Propionibacterium australiense]|uniref:Predicted HD phosphohydrolase n=1 Tax=Propionibacterium australiense TaxID=119981 RepID=A0A383S3U3_9ACTN|nr:metal-dependent phosphohydrolase [Propionibacterium australiense]SYZ32698.1 Predicted HD phosphohydrolase [Propionibacterium australiense]VEH91531.1 Uncharacterized protein conserved in bacteria [Propionibacterium australiense]